MNCSECIFFFQASETRADCRRYPPTPIYNRTYEDCFFPEVVSDDWCGEFRSNAIEKSERPE